MTNELICTPVMLRASLLSEEQKDHTLWMTHMDQLIYTHTSTPGTLFPQHLYLVCVKEVKDGDWYIDNELNTVFKVRQGYNSIFVKGHCSSMIIATTDLSLSLPLIPNSFIEEYVAKQGKIEKVMLRPYTDIPERPYLNVCGYVDILPIEDKMYSREQVKEILWEYHYHTWSVSPGNMMSVKEWFDINY
jgi:hypothetical protein